MRVAVAGTVLLVVMAAGCGRKDRPANDGFGAGAAGDTALSRDTLTTPGMPDSTHRMQDSTVRDSTYRPQ